MWKLEVNNFTSCAFSRTTPWQTHNCGISTASPFLFVYRLYNCVAWLSTIFTSTSSILTNSARNCNPLIILKCFFVVRSSLRYLVARNKVVNLNDLCWLCSRRMILLVCARILTLWCFIRLLT
jgi:hypothetical protein